MPRKSGDGSLPFATSVNKYLSQFPDLRYDGIAVFCLVCNTHLSMWSKRSCRSHVESARHVQIKTNEIPYTIFIMDFLIMLTACNLPYLVRKEPFKKFWEKYVPLYKLPSNTTLQSHLPRVKTRLENVIKSELCDKKIWITVKETTDLKENSIVHVMVRVLSGNNPGARCYLLACKRVQQSTAENIQQVIKNALTKFHIGKRQVLMFVTDGSSTMLKVGQSLKQIFPNLIHITCVLHALHLVAEVVQQHYENVTRLIISTQAVFHKSAKRTKEFQKCCPHIPQPPEPIFTRWGTWLATAFYYVEHFEQIKSVVMQFNPQDSKVIRESQQEFVNPQVPAALQKICSNYKILLEAIEKFQNSKLSLYDSLQILERVNVSLQRLSDTSGICASQKLADVLRENPDLNILQNILKKCNNCQPLSVLEQQFMRANITSLDAEESFSLYKNIFSCQQTAFTEATVETYAMVQMYSHSQRKPRFTK